MVGLPQRHEAHRAGGPSFLAAILRHGRRRNVVFLLARKLEQIRAPRAPAGVQDRRGLPGGGTTTAGSNLVSAAPAGVSRGSRASAGTSRVGPRHPEKHVIFETAADSTPSVGATTS